MWKRRNQAIEVKSPGEVAAMREAGLVVARTLGRLSEAVKPGITTADLDVIAEDSIRSEGGTPSFKGYQGFPASICTSANEQVVHGIPSPRHVLHEGDIISIDCGAIVDGWHGDAAVTVPVGEIPPALAKLLEVCEEALWRGLAAGRAQARLTDISNAVESYVQSRGQYGIVEDYVGHGIGSQMHMDPAVPNYGPAGRGPRLAPGMCFAVEPMVTLGSKETLVLDDEWTVITADGLPSAHFEHTFAVTEAGPWVLTSVDGGRDRLVAGSERPKDAAQP